MAVCLSVCLSICLCLCICGCVCVCVFVVTARRVVTWRCVYMCIFVLCTYMSCRVCVQVCKKCTPKCPEGDSSEGGCVHSFETYRVKQGKSFYKEAVLFLTVVCVKPSQPGRSSRFLECLLLCGQNALNKTSVEEDRGGCVIPSKPIEVNIARCTQHESNKENGSIKKTALLWNVCGQLSNHRMYDYQWRNLSHVSQPVQKRFFDVEQALAKMPSRRLQSRSVYVPSKFVELNIKEGSAFLECGQRIAVIS
jgi:hypothetical protein